VDNPSKSGPGLARIGRAYRHSRQGLAAAFRHESAFRQELVLVAVLLPVVFVLPATLIERAMLVGSLLFILAVELLNSGLEAAFDRISVEHHELTKRGKDIASAAVFVALINAAVVWLLVLLEIFARPG